MPTLSRIALKLGLVYLLLGLTALGVFGGRTVLGLGPWSAALFPTGLHLLTVGWLTHLIFGVAHWMFPKRSRELPRGREVLVGWSLALLNGGIVLRTVAEPLVSVAAGALWAWLLAVAGVLQLAAAALFVANTWPRIKGARSVARS